MDTPLPTSEKPPVEKKYSLKTIIVFSVVILCTMTIAATGGYYFANNSKTQRANGPSIPGPTSTSVKPTEGILNEAYIEALTFPPLQGKILEGADTTYPMPQLQTYNGDTFTFQYPVDYSVSKDSSLATILTKDFSCKLMGSTTNSTCKTTIKVVSTRPSLPVTLNDWFIQEYLLYFMNNGKVIENYMKDKIRTTNVAGEKALFNLDGEYPGAFSNGIVFVHKNQAYSISLLSSPIASGAAATFREVIDSFKFK